MEVCLSPRPGRFTPGKAPWYPLNRGLGGAQSRCERFGEEQNQLPLTGFKPQTIQPVALSLN